LGAAAYCYQRLGRDGLAGTLAVMGELDAYRLTQPQASVEVPWLVTDPLPVLAVRVNGCNANLVLDTGAGDTLLATQFAIDAGVQLGGQEQRTFAGGRPARVTYGHAEELSLGDFGIQDIPVLPDNSYSLIFLTFFRRDVNLKSLVIGTAKENPES
jgi:hypothetical protein